MAEKRIPAPFERPSLATLLQAGLAAMTMGVVLYPFVFDAFGIHDNPFDQPRELLSIAMLSFASLPILAVVVVLRRIIAPFVSRHAAHSR